MNLTNCLGNISCSFGAMTRPRASGRLVFPGKAGLHWPTTRGQILQKGVLVRFAARYRMLPSRNRRRAKSTDDARPQKFTTDRILVFDTSMVYFTGGRIRRAHLSLSPRSRRAGRYRHASIVHALTLSFKQVAKSRRRSSKRLAFSMYRRSSNTLRRTQLTS